MARPKLGRLTFSLRLTPSAALACELIADALPGAEPETRSPVGPVCNDAFRWLAETYGLAVDGYRPALVFDADAEIRAAARKAVDSASTEPRSETVCFTAPAVVRDLVSELSDTIGEMPRYSTRLYYSPQTDSYIQGPRVGATSQSLVLWAAIIEYLDALTKS